MKILAEISEFVLKYRQYKNSSSDSTKYIGITIYGRITNPYTQSIGLQIDWTKK